MAVQDNPVDVCGFYLDLLSKLFLLKCLNSTCDPGRYILKVPAAVRLKRYWDTLCPQQLRSLGGAVLHCRQPGIFCCFFFIPQGKIY